MSKKSRARGDRRDGRRVRDIDPMHAFLPYLMPNRCDAEVYLHEEVDVTALLEHIRQKNEQWTDYHTTPFHAIVMAVAKTIWMRPMLNRFICGRRYYDRDVISLSFVAKRRFADHAEESIMILRMKEDDTLSDVTRKIVGDVKQTREAGSNDLDQTLATLAKLPRFMLRIVMAAFRFLDFHGWMPAFISDTDPNYTSVLLSNLGSIKCPAPYHHLNNYGTNSVMITIGEIHKATVTLPDGSQQLRDVVDVGMTLDERIGDGFYFARSFKLLQHLLQDPQLLELPLKEEIAYEYQHQSAMAQAL